MSATTAARAISVDDVPLNRFHARITFYTSGGAFTDGYILGIIAIALSQLTPQLKLTPVTAGLVSSAALGGVFFGALFLDT